MSGESSSPATRLRNSENKLYQACLDACIEGIGKLEVDKRSGRSATLNPPKNNTHADLNSNTQRAAASPTILQPAKSLPSPPQSPVIPSISLQTGLPSLSPASTTAMDRSMLHGAPPRGSPPPRWGLQDARSNLAVQPAANAGNVKLKKNAVKIVGAAGPTPNASPRPAAPAPTMKPSPAPAPVKATANEVHVPVPAKPTTTPGTLSPAPRPVPSKVEIPEQSDDIESALDGMFSRLTTQNSATPSSTTQGIALARPDKSMFSFEDRLGATEIKIEGLQSRSGNVPTTAIKPQPATTMALPENKKEPAKKTAQQEAKISKPEQEKSRQDLEAEYLRKASEYIGALPTSHNTTVQTIQIVMKKLRSAYVPDVKLDTESNEILKTRYVFAVAKYVRLRKGAKPLTTDFVKQLLKDNDGDFLQLCATLVEEKYIALENLDDVTGLCNIILAILLKPEPASTIQTTTTAPIATTSAAQEAKPRSNDPVDNMTAWPTQEKRDNVAGYRTCVLKGVSGMTSINQLQALVWGGRLESISMPEAGSGFALVKFLTPEACQKYYEATENGIEIPGDKKTVVFVEKTAGPNSINDVIQNCIDGDASRCVRAVGVDEEWSDMALMKLARGKDRIKREVDRIKRGKATKGYDVVDFRFANIYHALGFKRQLMDDDEFEECTIGYAPDPCETARGVHFKDDDEGGSGSST